jgi:membrane-associated protein
MAELLQQLRDVFVNLFNSHELMAVLARPEMTVAAFVALNLIVFVETGLFFLLPGDSLLVTAGLVAYGTHQAGADGWNVPLLLGTLCASAILGDSVGYAVGLRSGPRIFTREKSWFFRKDHLLAAEAFYEKHGGKTIVLARFMPIIRTFAPIVAGVGRMRYPRFLFFNFIGGVGWVTSMVLLGYYLPTVIDPPFKRLFGVQFDVKDHVEKVIIVVVLLSISPGIYAWVRAKLGKRRLAADEVKSAA